MRADRLLSMMILLQDRGRLTAKELAEELEVTERTIYRDMVALSTAGVPVYAERGPGGGCSLVDSYRTNLTGLTRDEVRALFMLSVPAPVADLGADQDLKAALLKLSAALPEVFRPDETHVQQLIHLDSTPWFHQQVGSPHLQTIHEALWGNRKVKLSYRLAFEAQIEHLVEPYGLVAKINAWHLVFSRERTIFVRKLTDILDAKLTDEQFDRPSEFDLGKFWSQWCKSFEETQPQFSTLVRLKPDLVRMLRHLKDPITADLPVMGSLDADDWYTMTLHFASFEEARDRLLDFGSAAEVLEPLALRSSIHDFAAQIQAVYD